MGMKVCRIVDSPARERAMVVLCGCKVQNRLWLMRTSGRIACIFQPGLLRSCSIRSFQPTRSCRERRARRRRVPQIPSRWLSAGAAPSQVAASEGAATKLHGWGVYQKSCLATRAERKERTGDRALTGEKVKERRAPPSSSHLDTDFCGFFWPVGSSTFRGPGRPDNVSPLVLRQR